MSLSTNSTTPIALTALVTSAALVVAQTDWFSRTIACTPEQLQRKRIASYQYQWNQALIQQIRIFRSTSNYQSPKQTMECAELLTTDEEIQELVPRLVRAQQQHSSKGKQQEKEKAELFHELRIVHIGRDSEIIPSSPSTASSNPIDAYFVWLQYFESDEAQHANLSPPPRRLLQVPMVKFGLAYKEAMEKFLIRNSTLCFIYDTTPQWSSSIIVPLLTEVTKLFPPDTTIPSSSTIPPVNISQNPAWIVQLALLLAASKEDPTAHTALQHCMFAFCCLETSFLRALETTSHNTMIYTISTSLIPIVLPVLHDLFPDDRHVFLYTGCVQALSQKSPVTVLECNSTPNAFHSNVAWTTPIYMISNNYETSSSMLSAAGKGRGHVRPEAFYRAMTQLPLPMASHTESWMAALDALLVRQKQKGISFLPYVCKIDYLLPSSTDMTNRRWSVRSLLQYVTGTKSREMASETLDAACRWLDELPPPTTVSPRQRAVENVVFQHKLILLPNKTLVDTVQPSEHWTLKQSAKLGGCSCCGPNDDEEEEEDIISGAAPPPRDDLFSINPVKTRGFVDGKTAFAFDPSQFA